MHKEAAPVILLDLDKTMLDSTTLGNAIVQYFEALAQAWGLPEGRIVAWTSAYYDQLPSRTEFDPSALVAFWHQQLRQEAPAHAAAVTLVQLQKDFTTFVTATAAHYLYPDTIPALQQWQAMGYVLCLFTQGVRTWQKLKVMHADLARFFQPPLQFVSPNKAAPAFLYQIRQVLAQHGYAERPAIIVDDKLAILEQVGHHWPGVYTVLVDRTTPQPKSVGRAARALVDQALSSPADASQVPAAVVKDLLDLSPLIQALSASKPRGQGKRRRTLPRQSRAKLVGRR